MPDGTPITINNVNQASESDYYIRNTYGDSPGNLSTEYDGMTVLLATVEVPVERDQELFIQIVIAGALCGWTNCSFVAACLSVHAAFWTQ